MTGAARYNVMVTIKVHMERYSNFSFIVVIIFHSFKNG